MSASFKLGWALLVLLLWTVAFAKKSSKEEAEATLVLTKDNFDETIKANDLVLVEFYAPWCGHCKKLAPEYEKAAQAMAPKGVIVAKVDATQESELGQRFDIKGYPTLKVFRSGEPSDYNGERSAAGIIKYLTNQVGPAVMKLATVTEVDSFIPTKEEEAPVVIAFTDDSSPLGLFFASFAKQNRDSFRFGLAPTADLAEHKKVKEGTIVMFKPYDDLQVVYNGPADKTDLLEFLKKNSFKSVDEIGPNNYQGYVDRGLPIAWLFLGEKEEANEAAKAAYRQVAGNYKTGISFVYLSGTKYKQMAEKLALSGDNFPSLAIENKEGEHFVYGDSSKPFTVEALEQFFADFSTGKIGATTRSQPVPQNPVDEDNVYTVVGDNFKDVVFDTKKDVLIEFYAPWCGHCKQLAPTYGKVATLLKDVKTVALAKSDATLNDFPAEFKVSGFPTLKLVTAETNTVIDFSGDRSEQGIIDFLKNNCVHKFEIPKAGAASDANDEL